MRENQGVWIVEIHRGRPARSWLPLPTGGELAAAISCRLEHRERRRPHPWFSISRIALNGGAGANDITASRPGVVVALQVVRGRRERVGDPLVDYQHRPAVGEYRPHRAVQAVPI